MMKKRCGVMWIWFPLFLAAIGWLLYPHTVKADDFSSGQLEAEWTLEQMSSPLLLPVYGFDQQNGASDRGTRLMRPGGSGDWVIETQILGDTAPGSQNIAGGLAVYGDAKNYLLFGLENRDKIVLFKVFNGKESRKSIDGGAGYFRIVRQGAAYSFHYSEDGESWADFPSDFQDSRGALQEAQVGILNRSIGLVDIFHSSDQSIPCYAVRYGCFRMNGTEIPLSFRPEDGWQYQKSQGVFPLSVDPGQAVKLLRQQKEKDWVLDARLNYSSAGDTGLAGLTIYRDEENYLFFGLRGAFKKTTRFEVRGKIDGQDTGTILSYKGALLRNRTLRIIRRTENGQPDQYYFYLAAGNGEFDMICLGSYADEAGLFRNQAYGLMALEESGEAGTTFNAQFEFCSPVTPDGYPDYFLANVVDGMWEKRNVLEAQAGGGVMRLTADQAAAELLRAPLPMDWIIDLNLLPGEAFSGLTVAGAESALRFGIENYRLTVKTIADGQSDVCTFDETSDSYLRIVKDGSAYHCLSSANGVSWREIYCFQDQAGGLQNARYGIAAEGTGVFQKFSDSPRPAGAVAAIENIEFLFPLSGEDGVNQTQSRWGFGSGDLGSLFEAGDKVYMVFGDSFSGPNLAGNWMRNVLARGRVDAPAQGILYDQVFTGRSGGGLVTPDFDYTSAMIPSCGFGLDENTLYIWVHEIYSWQSGGHRDISGMGWAVSRDGGETWQYTRLFDASSVFQFVSAFRQDGFLYLFGNLGGGYGETYLMRVRPEEALDRSAYRFFAGWDGKNEPAWSPEESDAVIVLDYSEREIGITYNPYLGCYLMTGWDSFTGAMVLHESPTLCGPWSPAYKLLDRQAAPNGAPPLFNTGIYGAYTLPWLTEENGKSMYFTLSVYNPYQVYWIRADFAKKDSE